MSDDLVRVLIDLNVRTRHNWTFTGREDAFGSVSIGQLVEVFEEESGIYGPGIVTDIDEKKRLVYLSVDWGALRLPEDEED